MVLWQILASIAAVLFPLLAVLNVYLLNQVRIGVTDLKVQMLEARAQDIRELRGWVEAEFMRRDSALAVTDALSLRIAALVESLLKYRQRAKSGVSPSSVSNLQGACA